MEVYDVSEENELDTHMIGEVLVRKGDEAKSLKSLHQKNLVKAKKIIADSIMDHLIPQVSSTKTPKYMFDSFTKLFEGKNINQKMILRKKVEEFEDPECRDHAVILYKGLSNQRKT